MVSGTDGTCLEVQRVVGMLCECDALRGKPKIVIVLACRGEGRDAAVRARSPPGLVAAAGPRRLVRAAPAVATQHSDVLLVHSSAPNTASWATEKGTFFIQSIAACMRRYGGALPFEEVLTRAADVMLREMDSRTWRDPDTNQPIRVMSTPFRTSSLCGAIRLHQVSPRTKPPAVCCSIAA